MPEQPNPNVDDIKGYRRLTPIEIELLNEGKELAEQCRQFIDKLDEQPGIGDTLAQALVIDKRWLSIGRTDLQKGFMSVIRSIAKPTSF